MKTTIKILKGYMLLIGLFIIFMAFDCFEENSFFDNIMCFLISIIPAVLIIIPIIIFWKKDYILKYIILILDISMFILFKMYNITQQWSLILIIFIPLLLYSLILFLNNK